MKELQDKAALVTAATKGIGKACAMRLAQGGATVYIAAITVEEGQEVVDLIERAGGKAKSIYFDARKVETYKNIVVEVVRDMGKIDILVNNYGSTDAKRDLDLVGGDTDTFFHVLEDIVRSVYLPSKEAIKYMKQNGGGSIINISSIGSIQPDVSRTAYGVAKAAVNFLTKDIAVQYARDAVRCNAVLPGLTATESLMKNMSEEFIDAFLKHVPLNRVGKPEDIADLVFFLASDRSSFITGETLSVAGGYGIPAPLYAEKVKW